MKTNHIRHSIQSTPNLSTLPSNTSRFQNFQTADVFWAAFLIGREIPEMSLTPCDTMRKTLLRCFILFFVGCEYSEISELM